jgi:hypothetical protein
VIFAIVQIPAPYFKTDLTLWLERLSGETVVASHASIVMPREGGASSTP